MGCEGNGMSFASFTDDGLERVVDQAGALLGATHQTLLEAIREVDARGLWQADGAARLVDWVAMRLGVEHRTAKRLCTVADDLATEPHLEAALGEGILSLDQVDAALGLTDRVRGTDLVEVAVSCSPAQLRARSRRQRTAPRSARSVRWGWSADGSTFRVSGRLPADEGGCVETALERLRDQVPPNAETGRWDPPDQRAADALVELASLSLTSDPDPERATVVVHLDTTTGEASDPHGTILSRDVIERLLCDAHVAPIVEDDGRTVGIGRRSRTIPAWLRRSLHARDTTCRFPGCWRTRWTHAHHIREWVRDEGPTDLDNLIRLCGHHHRAIHRGIRIDGDPNGTVRFYRSDGTEITVGTQRLDEHVRDRFIGTSPDPP
jgi:hypothetical protein